GMLCKNPTGRARLYYSSPSICQAAGGCGPGRIPAISGSPPSGVWVVGARRDFSARRAALSFCFAMRACSRWRLVIVGRDRCAISDPCGAAFHRGGEVPLILPAWLGAPPRSAIGPAAEPAAAGARRLRPRLVDRQGAAAELLL